MKLKGKCKEEFEKWYDKLVWSKKFNNGWYSDIDYFSPSAKYGVYVDYFNSVCMDVEVFSLKANVFPYYYDIKDEEGFSLCNNKDSYNTRPQARVAKSPQTNSSRSADSG